jgi:hypothetical protein
MYVANGEGFGKPESSQMGFTWEQAIAIEFMNFITLGGPQTISQSGVSNVRNG